jgi:hypothetical protein
MPAAARLRDRDLVFGREGDTRLLLTIAHRHIVKPDGRGKPPWNHLPGARADDDRDVAERQPHR